jgi:glucose/arabinose dehydrogenase
MRTIAFASTAFFATLTPVSAAEIATSVGTLSVQPVANGLEEPWGLAFLPDGRFLVTERDGRLMIFTADGGSGVPLQGVPDVFASGQGGLLDVMVPRDFATTREVFLSYAQPSGLGLRGTTALGRGRLSDDSTRLEDFTTIFADPRPSSAGRHFGSRIVEAVDGSIFLTIGDRGAGDLAQDPGRANGKVIHLTRDGQAITAVEGAMAGVHSLGHRNAQGAALDGQGQLWVVEHGAKGGDEVNRVKAGANYGWPVISYGVNYNNSPIGIGTEADGMEQPVHYWDPSIAPSGLMIYSGRMFPEWAGDFFVGSLKFGHIARLDPEGGWAEEVMQNENTGRVRDVREAPDGSIWFLSVLDGAVYRLSK